MSLATITSASLPAQVYAHDPEHEVSLTADPACFRPIVGVGTGWVKPAAGSGLWTAPVTARSAAGVPADSAWLEWQRSQMDTDTSDSLLTEIIPAPRARLLLIDCHEHLVEIVNAFPADADLPFVAELYPDWPGMAAAGWDGVYLTERGQAATRWPASGPDLYSWDLESMLWLRHAYTVGRTVQSAARSEVDAA
ncbi:hypothetical protein ABZX40_13205 [Streptomyces sp. NPDC004610]|uniref:hypothetical protein n=1 Tax=unclassified Streptomyces TaxID=2593676 RepID=UPI0033B44D46